MASDIKIHCLKSIYAEHWLCFYLLASCQQHLQEETTFYYDLLGSKLGGFQHFDTKQLPLTNTS